jgi:hypothetical protein
VFWKIWNVVVPFLVDIKQSPPLHTYLHLDRFAVDKLAAGHHGLEHNGALLTAVHDDIVALSL